MPSLPAAGAGLLGQLDAPDPVATPEIDWSALLPVMALALGAVVLILVSSLVKDRLSPSFNALFTIVAAGAAIVTAIPLWNRVQDESDGPFSAVAGAIGIDGFSVFVTIVIAAAVILAALLADEYVTRERLDGPEFYVLLLLSAAGGVIMAMANDLIVLFVGLEILSISAYVLAAIDRRRRAGREAGMKYFVLGAFSSAFLLYGVAFVYGATGSTNLVVIRDYLADNLVLSNGTLLLGLALLIVGLGFKVAAVPFHAWAPDVYEGAPSPVVAFMASAIKAAAFAAFLRVFSVTFDLYASDWQPVLAVLAVLTLLVGALLAIVQTDVKRMMAYSSINHAGFILLGVHAASDVGVAASLFYIAAYTFLVIGTFTVITVVAGDGDGRTALADYRGLGRSRPVLALTFTVLLLAQAGVPLTSGFFAKFEIIGAAVDGRSYGLAVVAMLSAVIAAFVYLRLVVTMYMGDEADDAEAPARVPAGAGLALFITVAVTLVVGFLPWILQEWAADAVPVLVASVP